MRLSGYCGCSVTIQATEVEPDRVRVTTALASHDTCIERVADLARKEYRDELSALGGFLASVGLCVHPDAEVRMSDEVFIDDTYLYLRWLGLSVEFTDYDSDYAQAVFTLLSADDDSLGYCHVGVTLDVSSHDLLRVGNGACNDVGRPL